MRDTAAIAFLENFPFTDARVFADDGLDEHDASAGKARFYSRIQIDLRKLDRVGFESESDSRATGKIDEFRLETVFGKEAFLVGVLKRRHGGRDRAVTDAQFGGTRPARRRDQSEDDQET